MTPIELTRLAASKDNVVLPANTLLNLLEKASLFTKNDAFFSSDQPARLSILIQEALENTKEFA